MRVLLVALSILLAAGCGPGVSDGEELAPAGTLAVAGDAVADPASGGGWLVDFGSVRLGETSRRTVILRNVGLGPAEIAPLWLEAPFASDLSASETLQAGEERLVAVTLASDELGLRETVGVAIGTGLRVGIRFAAEVLPAPACKPEIDASVVFEWTSWDPAVIERRIDIRNTGDADCVIDSAKLEGSEAYTLAGLAAEVVRPGEAVSAAVLFDRFVRDDWRSALHVEIEGRWYEVALEAEERPFGPCDLALGGSSLGFGTVAAGTEHDRTIEIRNRGSEACPEGSAILEGEGFSTNAVFPALDAGASTAVAVRFVPAREGVHAGRLRVESGEQAVEIPAIGYVVASCGVHESAIDFGEVPAGCAITEHFWRVVNRCSEPIVAHGIDIEGSSEFKVRRRPAGIGQGIAISPGSMIEFTLAYFPEDAGVDEGQVILSYEGQPASSAVLRGSDGAYPVDSTICGGNPYRDTDWSRGCHLMNTPRDTDGNGTIEVATDELRLEVDGVRYDPPAEDGTMRWSYDAAANTVRFGAGFLPPPRARVTVRYFTACLPW